ncbi:MAG: galactose oxidase, partial [Streptomyces sp.]|nr:galactose oxidase [Streptomyces sp.]
KIGSGKKQDSSLITPVLDLSNVDSPELNFNTEYKNYSNQTGSVDVTTDGGATWSNVWTRTTALNGPAKVEVPLTEYAGKSGVQLRFHFTGSYGYWWQLDDVFIGKKTYGPVDGALVAGTVKDANSGDAVNGATVRNADSPQDKGTTAATPDDAALGDGFYWMFTSKSGSHKYTASKKQYVAVDKTVDAVADKVSKADFDLKAGKLEFGPNAIDKTVEWGTKGTQNLTVKNTGGAPATLTLGEQPGGFTQQAKGGAPLNLVKGDFSPLALTKESSGAAPAANEAGDAWQPVANLPSGVQDNIGAVYGGKVYSGFGWTGSVDSNILNAYDPEAGTWSAMASAPIGRQGNPAHGFIGGKLYVSGGWSNQAVSARTDVYDPATNSWDTKAPMPTAYAGSGSAVLNGKLYVVGGCPSTTACGATAATVYDPASDSWNQIASYPEPISWQSCGGIGGKLYCAGGSASSETKHAYVYDPAADEWSPIADMPADLWGSAYGVGAGKLLVSGGVINGSAVTNQSFAYDPAAGSWSALPNANTSAYRLGGASGFYKMGGNPAGNGAPGVTAVEMLPGYDQGSDSSDVSWLSTSKNEVTLQPGESTTITVGLDATVDEMTQPGDYTAVLTAENDTPYSVKNVDVKMHVNPPHDWGKYAGTVLGDDGKGGTTPLSGATIQIDTPTQSYTLKTAKDGAFGYWFDSRLNPVKVIVSKDGYKPVTASVKLTKGGTVIGNFTLQKTS